MCVRMCATFINFIPVLRFLEYRQFREIVEFQVESGAINLKGDGDSHCSAHFWPIVLT